MSGAMVPKNGAEGSGLELMSRDYQQHLIDLAGKYLYQNYRQPPLVLVRGKGSELWDAEGRCYLDLYAGIAVNTLGHAHPRLVEAISKQASEVIHLSNYFFNEPNILLAEKLCALTQMDRALFCNSGTEAVEALLKLARHHFFLKGEERRFEVVAFEQSFHGRTLGALAATGQAGYRTGFGPLTGVKHVAYGDLAAVERVSDDSVCAILVEPVQGEGGIVPAPPGFLRGLRELADKKGILLLADEIQTGMGRTGAFLAFQHTGVEPDALALAKGLAGGLPIGAMLCKQRLEGALPPGSHGTTFGGNPLASAAALAVLSVIEEEDLVGQARDKGAHLARGLQALAERYPLLASGTRGLGLLQALVLRDGVDVRAIHAKLREAGLLLTLAGGCALRFTPALTITTAELDRALDLIDGVFKVWS